MPFRRTVALLSACLVLVFAVAITGCGSSGSTAARPHHSHAVAKAAVGALVIHHLVKRHGGRHATAKALAGGLIIHHIAKRHSRR